MIEIIAGLKRVVYVLRSLPAYAPEVPCHRMIAAKGRIKDAAKFHRFGVSV
jgi:alkylated DNA nucleotide flippase Atl1